MIYQLVTTFINQNKQVLLTVETEASSVQVAYSAGGLSVRLAEQTVDNAKLLNCNNSAERCYDSISSTCVLTPNKKDKEQL